MTNSFAQCLNNYDKNYQRKNITYLRSLSNFKYYLIHRYRTLADIEQFEDQPWECLIHTARAVIYLLTSQHEQVEIDWVVDTKDRLIEGCQIINEESLIHTARAVIYLLTSQHEQVEIDWLVDTKID